MYKRQDLDAIRAAGHPTATAIIVTNGDDLGELKMLAEEMCIRDRCRIAVAFWGAVWYLLNIPYEFGRSRPARRPRP